MEKNNNSIGIGRTFLLVGGIISFVAGFFMVLLGLIIALAFISYTYYGHGLILWSIFIGIVIIAFLSIDLIGGIKLLNLRKLEDDKLIENINTALIWGIILIFTNFFGGAFAITGYILITRSTMENKTIVEDSKLELDELEKAFELKEKGLITDAEYEELKKKAFNKNRK